MPIVVCDLGASLVSKPTVSVEVPHGAEKPQGTRDTVPLAPTAERWWVKGGPGLILGVSHAGRGCAIEVEQTKLQGRCFGWSLGALLAGEGLTGYLRPHTAWAPCKGRFFRESRAFLLLPCLKTWRLRVCAGAQVLAVHMTTLI